MREMIPTTAAPELPGLLNKTLWREGIHGTEEGTVGLFVPRDVYTWSVDLTDEEKGDFHVGVKRLAPHYSYDNSLLNPAVIFETTIDKVGEDGVVDTMQACFVGKELRSVVIDPPIVEAVAAERHVVGRLATLAELLK